MELPEPPECPVCLQPYGGDTTPRVLACGHSACQTCLTQLPNPFPHTIRCPACTQLVKYPHPQGPSALPKNIDLLRLSSLLQQPNSTEPQKPIRPNKQSETIKLEQHFVPNLWSHEFYSNWKDWIIPNDAVLVESNIDDDEFCSVLYGRTANYSGLSGSPMWCLLKENQMVSLVRVGSFLVENDPKFNYSHITKVMLALHGMKDDARKELDLILRASLKQCRICKVCGLWYRTDDQCVYLVCERHIGSFLKKMDDSTNESAGEDEKRMNFGIEEEDMHSFAMIGMEICEAVSGLHSEGLFSGCLGLSCFNFDNFGRLYVDFNEVFATGMRVRRVITKAFSGKQKFDEKELEVCLSTCVLKTKAFVSPELLFELLREEGIDLGSGSSRHAVRYGSDVWSLACVLIRLLIGKPFIEEMCNILILICLNPSTADEKGFDYMGLYMGWLEKVVTLLETRLGSDFVSLKEILCKCLDFDPGSRPILNELWKCIRELIIKPKFDKMIALKQAVTEENTGHCLVLGELCQLLKETDKQSRRQMIDGLPDKDENGEAEVDQVGESRLDRDLVEGLSGCHIKHIDLKGHLDCVTGLAIGGGYLFSSSYDRTIRLWSLQDFTHVHSFKGHEHKVMAVVFVDEEQPLCISGDSGGGICIWGISSPFGQEPIMKLYEQKDWRYSGIHALAVSGTGYLYTGSGDKSIKAWSLQDYTLLCTMNGHKSVVSSLAVCHGVLYSGSWDGTVRLWCLSDHSPLGVLGEDTPGDVSSVLSLTADQSVLIVAHENGSIKVWRNDILLKSTRAHNGAIVSVIMEGQWIFTGGWDKTLNVQELSGDESQIDVIPVGSIACDSVIAALLYWQGKLFVGQADRVTKVYYYGE